MPPIGRSSKRPCLHQLAAEVDQYPADAFSFVQQALSYSVEKLHGGQVGKRVSRHITGQQLCLGLREYSLMRWGLLASTVLRHWNINSTMDIGRIVFALINAGMLHKTEQDSLEDFRRVYDFRTAFDSGYRIPVQAEDLSEARP